jgi:hypothetical protein
MPGFFRTASKPSSFPSFDASYVSLIGGGFTALSSGAISGAFDIKNQTKSELFSRLGAAKKTYQKWRFDTMFI